jgi:hypothetical protein
MFWRSRKKAIKPQTVYQTPNDMRHVLTIYPIGSVQFSIALLKVRMKNMDPQDKARAEKTLKALHNKVYWDTGHAYNPYFH